MIELLNEWPWYVVVPGFGLTIFAIALLPPAMLHYADRHLQERQAALVTIIICVILGGLLTLCSFLYG